MSELRLQNALEFFEKASSILFNPAKFCLPFYRSLYTITFKKYEEAKDEIQKYLAEAKNAMEDSKEDSESEELLLRVVEDLKNALDNAHKAKDMGLAAMKYHLNAHRLYCEEAANLLDVTQEKAPVATKLLIKWGLPLINQRIEEIISEIQAKAKALYEATRDTGTLFEPLGAKINQNAQQLSDIDSSKSEKIIPTITHSMRELCKLLPQDKRGYACELVKNVDKEEKLTNKLFTVSLALNYLEPNIEKVISEKKAESTSFNRMCLNCCSSARMRQFPPS